MQLLLLLLLLSTKFPFYIDALQQKKTKTTKRHEVQPGKDIVAPTSVQKAMSSGGSGMTEVMAHP